MTARTDRESVTEGEERETQRVRDRGRGKRDIESQRQRERRDRQRVSDRGRGER